MLPLSEILREDASAEALEYTLSQLSEAERFAFDKALQTVGGAAQTALPGVMQGASQGAALGPYGMLIGGAIGGAQSLMGGAGKKPGAAPRPRPVRPPAPVASPASPPTAPVTTPAAPPPVTGSAAQPLGGNPAAQLLMAVQDPRTLQALASLVAGAAGRQQIPVGPTTAEPTAFLNLLGSLSAQAAAAAPPSGAATHDYLRDGDGEYAWDVASPQARAQALFAHLHGASQAASPRATGATPGDWLPESGAAEVISSFY